MAFNYRDPKHPGPWQAFIQRKDVKDLPLMEQRQQYLKEQLFFDNYLTQVSHNMQNMNSQNAFQHQGGRNRGNDVTAIRFVGDMTALSSNDTFIDVVFAKPIDVDTTSGTPFINAINGLQGGGTAATVQYDYLSIQGSEQNIARFRHQHPSSPNGDAGIRAGVIGVGNDLVGSAAFTGTAGTAEAVSGVVFTTATGTGGSEGPATSVFDVIIAGGGTALSEISFVSSASAAPYTPGNTLSANAAALTTAGAADAGTLATVITLTAGDLTGDVLTLTGTSVDLNGGIIFSKGNSKLLGSVDVDYGTKEIAAGGAGTLTATAT